MTKEDLLKLKHQALLQIKFERGLKEALPHVFTRYEEGHFLLIRFHKSVSVPQVFWQLAGNE